MYCPNCGASINKNAEFCVTCGANVHKVSTNNTIPTDDKPNIWVNLLSLCCFPILGIIMYFVWKDKQPQAAKSALTFGLIGIVLSIILWVISFVLGIMDGSYY